MTRQVFFRFMLPNLYHENSPNAKGNPSEINYRALGLWPGEHITLEAEISGSKVKRHFHLISNPTDEGFIDLLVTVYRREMSYPKGGLFTQYLDSLPEIDFANTQNNPLLKTNTMNIISVGGNVKYCGRGNFEIVQRNSEDSGPEIIHKHVKRLGMISYESGISPMYQILQ